MASRNSEGPQRRCVCCRSSDQQNALLRFGVFQDVLCFDLRKKLPGRGYYVCARRQCLEKAFGGALKRATKKDVSSLAPTVGEFVDTVLIPGLQRRYREYLLAGLQSGQLLCGADKVDAAASSDRLAGYLLATDASESTLKKYRMNAERKGLPCLGLLPSSDYGELFGKSDKVILGWIPGKIWDEFRMLEAAIVQLLADFGKVA